MKLSVITPVGPGHQEVVKNAMRSVAFLRSGPFDAIRHVIIDDGEGRLGRSRARNLGMETAADWFFFLDADDLMLRHATTLVDFDAPAKPGRSGLELGLEERLEDRGDRLHYDPRSTSASVQ